MSGSSSGFCSALLLHHLRGCSCYLFREAVQEKVEELCGAFCSILAGLRLFFGNETKIFDLRPAVDDVSCRAFCFWQTLFPPRSSGVLSRIFHDEGINNGFPLGARVLPDVRGMAPSRELSNHQLSHGSIQLQLMIFPLEMIDASLTFPCARTSCTINYPTRLDLIFFIYNSVSILELLRL